MTARQTILKFIYPLFIRYRKSNGWGKMLQNDKLIKPIIPFKNLSVTLNNNQELSLSAIQNKKILLVNTASDCGYTNQYSELQKLYEQYKDKLEIIGFPANDFKEQEKGSDAAIEQFCKVNFGVSFPLAKKSSVVKGIDQNKIFYWLTHKEQNGWNDQQPRWNFSKYLVNEEGILAHYFDSAVSPLSTEMISAIEK